MRTKLDGAGRAVIPFQIRKIVDLKPGDEIEITTANRSLILTPVSNTCVICKSDQDLETVDNYQVCKKCLAAIKAEFERGN